MQEPALDEYIAYVRVTVGLKGRTGTWLGKGTGRESQSCSYHHPGFKHILVSLLAPLEVRDRIPQRTGRSYVSQELNGSLNIGHCRSLPQQRSRPGSQGCSQHSTWPVFILGMSSTPRLPRRRARTCSAAPSAMG